MLALRHRPLWIVLSLAIVLAVVWGSLQNTFGLPLPADGIDKVEHFGAYLLLAVWFTGLFRRRQYWWVALSLLALGLSLECLQYLMQSGRMADAYDMAANTAGVGAGIVLALTTTGGWAQKFESWLR
jgi:VanZ family protein